jgi:hypothetical protein
LKHAVLTFLFLALALLAGPHVASADAMPGPHATMAVGSDCAGCPDDPARERVGHIADGCASPFACALFIVPAADAFAFVVDQVDREPIRRTTLRIDTPDIPRILPPPRT